MAIFQAGKAGERHSRQKEWNVQRSRVVKCDVLGEKSILV